MATHNFYFRNTLFALTDEQFEEWYQSDTEILTNRIAEHVPALFYYYAPGEEEEQKPLRSYPSSVIAEFSLGGTHYGKEFYVTQKVILRHGYYSGVNIDLDPPLFELDGYEGDSIEDLREEMESYGNKLTRSSTNKLIKTANKLELALQSALEKVSNRYIVAASFSNGEALYSKA